jgi:hypothetical protein
LEYFALRHGIQIETILWEMDCARVLQLLYCESIKNGHTLRYSVTVEDKKTNDKLDQLERNLEQWLSAQQ